MTYPPKPQQPYGQQYPQQGSRMPPAGQTQPQVQQKPSQCSRCKQPVLQDPYQDGQVWVDPSGSRHCGGNPQHPHEVKKGSKKPLIIGSVAVAAVAVVVVAALVLAFTPFNRGAETSSDQSASGPPKGATLEQPGQEQQQQKPSGEQNPPGGPVPCDPERPHMMKCFPEELTGEQVMKVLEEKYQWECGRYGEKDIDGHEIDRAMKCSAWDRKNPDDQWTVDVTYETDTYDARGTTKKIEMNVGMSANIDKGVESSPQRVVAKTKQAMKTFLVAVWPENDEARTEAHEIFTELVDGPCASGNAVSEEYRKMSLGYQLTCSSPDALPIILESKNGRMRTLVQTITIDADKNW